MKVFKNNRGKQFFYASIYITNAVLIIAYVIFNIIKITQKKASVMPIGIRNVQYVVPLSNSTSEICLNLFMILFILVVTAINLNNVWIAHRSIELDDEMIHVYPGFHVKKIPWESIKSIHIGYMTNYVRLFPFYRMKIFYTLEDEHLLDISIPLLRFPEHDEIEILVREKCRLNRIDVFEN